MATEERQWETVQKIKRRSGQADLFIVQDREQAEDRTLFVKKVPKLRLLRSHKGYERFKAEIAVLRSINHPRVIELVGPPHLPGKPTKEDRPYYVMPHYPNDDLECLSVRGEYCLDTARAIPVFREILSGVKAIHDKEWAHRDLKPGNILMNDDGEPVIADFGLAFFCRAEEIKESRLTHAREPVGSRWFIAPEMATGINYEDDHRPADIYSLGKILYYILSGGERLAADEFDDPERDLAKMTGDTMYERVNGVLAACLCRDREKRYSIDQLLAALDGLDRAARDRQSADDFSGVAAQLELRVRSEKRKKNAEEQRRMRIENFCKVHITNPLADEYTQVHEKIHPLGCQAACAPPRVERGGAKGVLRLMQGLHSYVDVPEITPEESDGVCFCVDTCGSSSDEITAPRFHLLFRVIVIATNDHVRVILIREYRFGVELNDTLDEWRISCWDMSGLMHDPRFAQQLEDTVAREKRTMLTLFRRLLEKPPAG